MKTFGAVAWVAMMVGCAALGQGAPRADARKADAPVVVRFTSDVSDPYWVMSGPTETYRSIRVNARLRERLEGYARAKSGAGAGPAVEVLVHLNRVDTAYRQVGSLHRRGTRLALDRRPARTDASVPLLARDVHAFEGWRPYEITKVVEVELSAEVLSGGRSLAKEAIEVRLTEVTGQDDIDRWTYDYLPLVDRALGAAVDRLDDLVERALARAP